MASNGILNRAKNGTCRICQRRRNTDKYLITVGQVHHGFAVGYVWQCHDMEECISTANKTVRELNGTRLKIERIKHALMGINSLKTI